MLQRVDEQHHFVSTFDPRTGFYLRSGVIENGRDTGEDPFMSSFPELIDVGVMGHCTHGASGLCIQSGVQCYQNGLEIQRPNMTLENFKRIVDECKGKCYQFALGGRGDPDQHEAFPAMLSYCRENDIVPNFTTSGLGMDREKAELCRQFTGAVAVSWYRQKHTMKAIDLLLDAGVKTNIHYVLSRSSIGEAIRRLEERDFPAGINAVIFLLHKPVGLGSVFDMLSLDDTRVHAFFELVDTGTFPFKIGFDSCSIPAILNLCKSINHSSVDTCEGGRWSMYITSDMKALPCSFDNQDMRWAYDIADDTIQNAWNSPQFEDFRSYFHRSCPGCDHQKDCMGGCPIRPEIVLCSREERDEREKEVRD